VVVRVNLGPRSYDICVDVPISALGGRIAERMPHRAALVAADGNIAHSLGGAAVASLERAGIRSELVAVPPGESSKSLEQAARLYEECGQCGLDREGLIVAVGGGVCGDVAGFVAATYMRGVSWVQVPTTLLAQIDASVGGKVAVDHPRGKNLIGAIHQPSLVWCDIEALRTLSDRDLRAAMAEALKTGLITNAHYYRWVRRHAEGILGRDRHVLARVVAGACRVKAGIVASDEKEELVGGRGPLVGPGSTLGTRMVLNLGHTLGNNLEAVAGYGVMRHGEAVSVGLVAAGRVALQKGLWSKGWQRELESGLAGLHLPTRIPGLSLDELLVAMRVDKKAYGGRVRWILPVKPGVVAVRDDVTPREVSRVLVEMGASEK